MIKVDSVWLEHEGGTKFYQVFQLVPDDGKPVTVCHWGKLSLTYGVRNLRPVLGGETQVHEGRMLSSKSAVKTKRGYQQIDLTSTRAERDAKWFVEHFGAELAYRIEMAMFADKMTAAFDDLRPIPLRETTSIGKAPEPEAPRPEAWGTW